LPKFSKVVDENVVGKIDFLKEVIVNKEQI